MSYSIALLIEAASKGEEKTVKAAMERLADVNGVHNEMTALCAAVSAGHQNIVKLLLHIDVTFYEKSTIQYLGALLNSKRENVKDIKVALLDQQCKNGQTALHHAIIALGANEKADISNYPTRVQILKLLLQHGASVNLVDDDQRSALYMACVYKNYTTVTQLLQYGNNVNGDVRNSFDTNKTALMYACHRGDASIATAQFNSGVCDIHLVDSQGNNAQYFATQSNCHSVMKSLLYAKSDVSRALVESIYHGSENTIGFLLRHSGVNLSDAQSTTPLMHAVKSNNLTKVEILLEYKANIMKVDLLGKTALMHAEEQNYMDIVAILKKYSNEDDAVFSTNTTNNTRTNPTNTTNNTTNTIVDTGSIALLRACQQNAISTVELLLQCGVNVNYSDQAGKTAIHYVAEKGYKYLLYLLLDYGVDTECVDYEGMTAVLYASRNGHLDIINILKKNTTKKTPLPTKSVEAYPIPQKQATRLSQNLESETSSAKKTHEGNNKGNKNETKVPSKDIHSVSGPGYEDFLTHLAQVSSDHTVNNNNSNNYHNSMNTSSIATTTTYSDPLFSNANTPASLNTSTTRINLNDANLDKFVTQLFAE